MIYRSLYTGVLPIIFLIPFLFSGCTSHQKKAQSENGVYYTCTMHPQVKEDKPGKCPICGMPLVKMDKTASETDLIDSTLSYWVRPAIKTVMGSFKVIEPAKKMLCDTLTLEGYVDFDRRFIYHISSRVSGRIVKLYVNYRNQKVYSGQPLMTIYSPQLMATQKNLLQTIRDKKASLTVQLKRKLLNLGMGDREIKEVIKREKPMEAVTIYSPYEGIVQSVGSKPKNFARPALPVKEGMYIKKGQSVLSIQNNNKVRAILNIRNENTGRVKVGDVVYLYEDAFPEDKIKGKIDFISPFRLKDKKTTCVSVYLSAMPEHWKAGSLIHGQVIIRRPGRSWYLPLSAVNRLGMHDVAWVQDKKDTEIFQPIEVTTGMRTVDSIEIKSGLKPGDKVVANAAFMVGSESFLRNIEDIEDKPDVSKKVILSHKSLSQDAGTFITLSKRQQYLGDIQIDTARWEPFSNQWVLTGITTPDPRNEQVISAWVSGWIEEMYVGNPGEWVEKGQKLYDIYSPDLLSVEKDYLQASAHKHLFKEESARWYKIINALKQKLLRWGLSESQIENLPRQAPAGQVTVYSKASGYLIKKMNEAGDYIHEGNTVLTLADYDTLWVRAEMYDKEIPLLKKIQDIKVALKASPGEKIPGRKIFSSPVDKNRSGIHLLNIAIPNSTGTLQPGMLVYVFLKTGTQQPSVIVPATSIIRDEDNNYIWVEKSKNRYRRYKVLLGEINNHQAQVLHGIDAGAKVVKSGAYLLDSEFKLQLGNGVNLSGMEMSDMKMKGKAR